jgi:hypothetical protein
MPLEQPIQEIAFQKLASDIVLEGDTSEQFAEPFRFMAEFPPGDRLARVSFWGGLQLRQFPGGGSIWPLQIFSTLFGNRQMQSVGWPSHLVVDRPQSFCQAGPLIFVGRINGGGPQEIVVKLGLYIYNPLTIGPVYILGETGQNPESCWHCLVEDLGDWLERGVPAKAIPN